MRFARLFLLLLIIGFAGNAVADSIFNLLPPARTQNQPPDPILPVPPSKQPVQVPQFPLTDPKVLSKLEQQPNESSMAYLNRIKVISQQAISDLERTVKENNDKMKALAPK